MRSSGTITVSGWRACPTPVPPRPNCSRGCGRPRTSSFQEIHQPSRVTASVAMRGKTPSSMAKSESGTGQWMTISVKRSLGRRVVMVGGWGVRPSDASSMHIGSGCARGASCRPAGATAPGRDAPSACRRSSHRVLSRGWPRRSSQNDLGLPRSRLRRHPLEHTTRRNQCHTRNCSPPRKSSPTRRSC